MLIECGPSYDRRIFRLELPTLPKFTNNRYQNLWLKSNNLMEGRRIGCLISGGPDSALLYYLLIAENIRTGNRFKITPYTILRKAAEMPALNVTNWIHDFYGLPKGPLNIVGDNTLPEVEQVESGIRDLINLGIEYIYIGIMEDRPEHYTNHYGITFKETFQRRYPLINLQKSHIIDLFNQLDLFDLFKITTSCNRGQIPACGECNGCEARLWGIEQMGLKGLYI